MRATQAPEQWQLLLTALKHDDVDEAHRICMKYQFGKTEEPPKKILEKKPYRLYKYHYKMPSGKQGVENSTAKMAKLMGLKPGTVTFQFKDGSDTATWVKGQRKGWELTRVPKTGGV